MAKVIEYTNNSTGTSTIIKAKEHMYIKHSLNTTFLYLPKKDLADHGEPLAKCRLAHSWEFQSEGHMKGWQMAFML